jgi:hypothetical protein
MVTTPKGLGAEKDYAGEDQLVLSSERALHKRQDRNRPQMGLDTEIY